ncbi:Serine/threonine-protein kinase PAK 6 [Collichthys lucidus]|uniref:non-specific serine/threonine protein kinase n=1 Tax=Collichthys lucidus TaxID=240159 RepID=A0A4U5TUF5_COLLU|nr:Serine/threonine-protein kinase PAK 6 [Collichthys lucidus]
MQTGEFSPGLFGRFVEEEQVSSLLSRRCVATAMFQRRKKKRRPEISAPQDFQHRVHTSFDDATGRYVGLPPQWQSVIDTLRRPRPLEEHVTTLLHVPACNAHVDRCTGVNKEPTSASVSTIFKYSPIMHHGEEDRKADDAPPLARTVKAPITASAASHGNESERRIQPDTRRASF